MIPVVKFNSRMYFRINNGLLQRRYTNESTYTLLSKDSIISQSTKMFGQRTHVIGRSCTVDKSINSSSTPSGNFLFENYQFSFEGQITLTESCPQNGSIIQKNWTFDSHANIILPLICSINSSMITCGAVVLHFTQTEKITLEHHRMQIIKKETVEQAKASLNDTNFIRSSKPISIITKSPWISIIESHKWVIIGLGIFIVSLVTFITSYKLCMKRGQSDSAVSINIENNATSTNTSPLAPATTLAHTGTNPIEPTFIQTEPQSQPDPPSYASLDPAILKKDPRMYTMEDRVC